MVIQTDGWLNLNQIARSGQCFRWKQTGRDEFQIVAFERILIARQINEECIELDCSKEDFERIWSVYFDLERDYPNLLKSLALDDPFLLKAAEYGQGIRILRQDPWEVIISFLISQQRSIPSIKRTIENMSSCFGKPLGKDLNAFPTPDELYRARTDDYKDCKLGYRLDYIQNTARMFATGEITVEELSKLNDTALFTRLQELKGVGPKIANCIMLFGFNRLDAFPKDVWINRALKNEYPQGFNTDRYKPYNGIVQQFIYNYYRSNTMNKK